MTILNVLLEITMYSAILFAVTLLFKKLFKSKLSPLLHLAVWMLLIIRLTLPVTFDTAVHFITLPGETIQLESRANEANTEGSIKQNQTKNEGTGQQAVAESDESVLVQSNGQASALTTVSQPTRFDWQSALIAVWSSGMIVCAGVAVCGYSRLRRSLRRNALPIPDTLRALFDECLNKLKIKGHVKLSVQLFTHSPALLYPSTVLIPLEVTNMSEQQIRMALMHELTHHKRKDQLFAILLLVLKVVYWFNPVVHLAERIIRDDIETACDSSVVRRLNPVEKGNYARSLIAMYNSMPETQMVLGMALGGTRKGAEKRIRGIYSKQKSPWHVKLTALLLTGVMAVCCFTTACQPTPDKPVIVNKNQSYDNIMNDNNYKTADSTTVYSVPERLTENIEVGNVTIHADIPVELPQTTDFPVTVVKKRFFTEDEVNTIVNYFVKGRKTYKRKTVQTKDEILDMITEVKRGPLVDGVYDPSQADENLIKILEDDYKKAPETFEKEYVHLNQDYRLDYDGPPLERGEQPALNVNIENDTDLEEALYILNANDTSQNTEVYYNDDSLYYDETFFRENLDAPDIDVATDPYFRDWENQLKNTSMTEDEAIAKANAVLEALHIDDLALASVEHAAIMDANCYPCKGGYLITYMRSKGKLTGMPGYLWGISGGSAEEELPEYAPPFNQERIRIMLNEDGLHGFHWLNVVTEDQTICENAKLLPFEEIRQAAINQIKYKYSFRQNSGTKLRCEIEAVKLYLGYIGVKDDLNKALMVPMWVFVTQFYERNEGEASEFRYGYEAFGVNALDGSIVSTWPAFNH